MTPWTVACQAHLSMGFPRQEYQSELLFPLPGDLPDTGIETASTALEAGSFTTEPPGNMSLPQRFFSPYRRLRDEELMLLNCGAGEDS